MDAALDAAVQFIQVGLQVVILGLVVNIRARLKALEGKLGVKD